MKMGLSSFWDDFTGKSQIKSAYADSNAILNNAQAAGSQKYAAAEGEFDPWIKSGLAANDLYGNALGLNGPQGAESAWDAYSSNPGFLAAEQLGMKNLNRKYNAGGLNLSGADIQSSQLAGLNYYDTYLNKLKDQAGVGFNASSGKAGAEENEVNFGAGIAENEASNRISYGNSLAANSPFNNLLKVGGLAVSGINAFRNTSKSPADPNNNVLSGSYGTYGKSWQPVIVS
jgi:hypothetical protein